MTFTSKRSFVSRSLLVGAVMVATLAAPVSAEPATSFSGEATGVQVFVADPLGGDPLLELVLVEAGPLPPEGGQDDDELLNVDIDEDVLTLTASAIRAETESFGDSVESSATIADLELSLLGDPLGVDDLLDVSSTTLESNAFAACEEDGAVVSGDSVIEDLTINGTEIEVSGEPNQEVDLGLIQVVINEQIEDVADDGSFGEITVNAVRITVFDPLNEDEVLAEIILASSHADVTCMPDSSTDGLFSVTSGPSGTSGSPLPLAVLILAGVTVSFVLARSYARR